MSNNHKNTVKKMNPMLNFSRDSFKTVFTPRFYKDFHCIGDQCENHCCRHWTVVIDDETYNKYTQHGDVKIREVAATFNTVQGASGIEHKKINMLDNGNCPLLDEKGLCYVHKTFGESWLPPVCKIYPKDDKLIDGQLYNGLSISCPEAARKILLDPSAMTIKQTTVTKKTKLPQYCVQLPLKDVDLQREFKQLAYNCLLADNTPTIEGRLFNMAILFRLASQRIEKGDGLSALLNSFDGMLLSGELDQMYKNSPTALKVQEFVLQQLLTEQGYGVGNAMFVQYKQQALDKLKQSDAYDADKDKIQLTDYYSKHCQLGYDKLVDSHGHAFINLMLHWVYSSSFEVDDSKKLFNQFAVFALKFFYIRTLCGILNDNSDEEQQADGAAILVGVVHSISRKSDHDVNFANLTYDNLVKQGLAQPEHILGLIKV